MLYTNLKHLESAADHKKAISDKENVMVICGRMGPMCIPVYGIAEELEKEYNYVNEGIDLGQMVLTHEMANYPGVVKSDMSASVKGIYAAADSTSKRFRQVTATVL